MEKERLEMLVKQYGAPNICPRCGGPKGGDDVLYSSFSRVADVYICPKCGVEEAVHDMQHREQIRSDLSGYTSECRAGWVIVSEYAETGGSEN